nr:His/Gly/Thr/Pro-type tRNA ligase C-terminal domain-containing protein [Synergistales bacterium]
GEAPNIDVFVISADGSSRKEAVTALYDIRRAGISADIDYTGRSFKAQFKAAGSSGAVFACILGPEEVASGQVTLKDLRTAEQKSVRRAELTDFLKTWLR